MTDEQSELNDFLEWASAGNMAELYKECRSRKIPIPQHATKEHLVELIKEEIIRRTQENVPTAESKRARRSKATTKTETPPIVITEEELPQGVPPPEGSQETDMRLPFRSRSDADQDTGEGDVHASPQPPNNGTPPPLFVDPPRRNWGRLALGAAAVIAFLIVGLAFARNFGDDNGGNNDSADAASKQSEKLDNQATAATSKTAETAIATSTAVATTTPPAKNLSTGGKVLPFGNIEDMPRWSTSQAALGTWYHPVYNDGMFQKSGGMDGQWNWTNTIVLLQADGGRWIQAPDGELWFRHTKPEGNFSFAVKTTSKYKREFMTGDFPIQVSLDAFPTGASVHVLDENGKDLNGGNTIHLSVAGQVAVTLPDDGITVITVSETDPAGVFDFKARFGPDDRPDTTNHFDARKR